MVFFFRDLGSYPHFSPFSGESFFLCTYLRIFVRIFAHIFAHICAYLRIFAHIFPRARSTYFPPPDPRHDKMFAAGMVWLTNNRLTGFLGSVNRPAEPQMVNQLALPHPGFLIK